MKLRMTINNGKLNKAKIVNFFKLLEYRSFYGRKLFEKGIQIITSKVWNEIKIKLVV